METSRPAGVRELPIVGGHLALDFANTVDDPEGPARFDHVATYPGLLEWSVRVHTVSATDAERLAALPDPADALARAHTLRSALGALFAAVTDGAPPEPRHWAALRGFAAEAVANAELVPEGSGYTLGWPRPRRPESVLWPVAHAAVELLTAADLARVKRCAGCPWVFLDHSRNSSRRWCAMNDCGTHAKIRRYVARRAARRDQPAAGADTGG
ncbi:CGNR zinc finger domain-containing protein [Actinophytocola xanthii]|uniref:CGNR zinc finger domain-containing protein n=1 Tax=Actinophytocola xanthii TaxID=1912961 RepID=UPI001177973F|nr:ABATE domain-containing protein [Actinophytocola xanthii]